MNKLKSVKVKAAIDENPDFSTIGEYTDKAEEWSICRCCGEYVAELPEGHVEPPIGRACRYFNPFAAGCSVEEEGTEDYKLYGKQDFERAEAYNRGDWNYIGITAEATISYSTGNGSFRLEWLSSGGLWGIESDSGDEYLNELKDEQLADLKQHLERFNVDLSEWDEMTKDLELED